MGKNSGKRKRRSKPEPKPTQIADEEVSDVTPEPELPPAGSPDHTAELSAAEPEPVPEIPPMSIVRSVSLSDMVITDATRQQVMHAKPVILLPEEAVIDEPPVVDEIVPELAQVRHAQVPQVREIFLAKPPSPREPRTMAATDLTASAMDSAMDLPASKQSTVSADSPASKQSSVPADSPASKQSSVPADSPASKQSTVSADSPTSKLSSIPMDSTTVQSPSSSVPSAMAAESAIFGVCVVGFHHTRGPEVEYWAGPDHSATWPYLPFQSLPDGSHQYEENVVYFTLLYDTVTHTAPNPTFTRDDEGHIQDKNDYSNVVTLFAIACSRQTTLEGLTHSAEEEYTRPTVHKSVVVIARKPIFAIREKLTVVTRSYFNQKNFSDRSIIDHLYQNLVQLAPLDDSDLQVGIHLRDFVHKFGTQVLVLFKALLLEKKILFFASDTEELCTTQFALISLVPNLLNHLEDCGSPLLSSYETHLTKQTHLKASDRESLLKFMGLPLQVFAAGGMFSPFVPLQHLDELRQKEMQYGLVGTTNNLFLSAGIDFDITVDIDNSKISVGGQLTQADKQFMEPIVQAVREGWSDNNRWEPRSLGYVGSEDYIRHQFEDYVMALAACAKYDTYLDRHPNAATPAGPPREFAPHPLKEFGSQWAEQWRRTNNFRIFDKYTDEELFDIVDPVHVGIANHDSRLSRLLDLFRRPHLHEPKLAFWNRT